MLWGDGANGKGGSHESLLIGLNDHFTGHISSRVVYSGKTMEAGDDSSLIGRYAIEWGRGWGEATGRVKTPRIWAPGISGQ